MPENSGENREYSGEQDSRENMPIEKERIRSTRYERPAKKSQVEISR